MADLVGVKITDQGHKVLIEYVLEPWKSRDKVVLVKASVTGLESFPEDEVVKIIRPNGNRQLKFKEVVGANNILTEIDNQTFTTHAAFFNALNNIL